MGGWGRLIHWFVYNLTVPIAVLIAVLYFVCIFQTVYNLTAPTAVLHFVCIFQTVYNLTAPTAVLYFVCIFQTVYNLMAPTAVPYFVCIFQTVCAADSFIFLFSSVWDCVSSSVLHCSDKTCTLWADWPHQLSFIKVTKKQSFSSLLYF